MLNEKHTRPSNPVEHAGGVPQPNSASPSLARPLLYQHGLIGFVQMRKCILLALMSLWFNGLPLNARAANLPNPILFVTQVPVPGDFTSIGSVFGNHQASLESVSRGGDLYILYPDGTLKNLTRVAGYGKSGSQAGTGIAVRQPSVHWDGKKAVFSMVIGAPSKQYQVQTYFWQLYEITGLGQNETPVITKVPNQPANFNNISPIYGTDDRIIFTSDRPRTGEAQLYPQLDEYEEAPTVTGLWSLDPATGDLAMLNHTPSGAFSPFIDSFGRLLFTRWDHLQRDQQADADNAAVAKGQQPTYNTFNYSDETANATILKTDRTEIFPEPRSESSILYGHTFNQFFPWQINEDGTEEETLNHVGRHELTRYIPQSFKNDPALDTFYNVAIRYNTNSFENFIQMAEDPLHPGTYFGIDAPEFGTHASGQILTLDGPPTLNPDKMVLHYITSTSTKSAVPTGQTPPADHTGLYRNPLPLSDGQLVAVHTATKTADRNSGTTASPASLYDLRMKFVTKSGTYFAADQPLTPGITATISYYNPDTLVTFSGVLWELDPVEVRARTRPPRLASKLPSPEEQIFTAEQVDVAAFKNFLRTNNLAVIVSRNVTTRDHSDKQQPFNLRIAGTSTKTVASAAAKLYDISHMQFFEADQLRGVYGGSRAGRRVIAQNLHGTANDWNAGSATDPVGSVRLGIDGSMAAFVPARRAMTWQLTDTAGAPVVRERYWLTFQPGEIRSCTSCHGINQRDQAGNGAPTNPPEALRSLLRAWKSQTGYASQLRFAALKRNTGPKLTLQSTPAASQILILETSSDLTNWTPVRTNANSPTGSSWDVDISAFRGFYRINAR